MSVITHSVQQAAASNEDLLNRIRATSVFWNTMNTKRLDHNMRYSIYGGPWISINQALLPAPDMATAVGCEVRNDIFRQFVRL